MVWSPLVVFTASHLDGHGHYQCQLWRWARPKWQLIEANVVLRRSRMQAFCPKCLLFFSLFCVILEQIRSKQLSCSPTCAAALFSDSVLIWPHYWDRKSQNQTAGDVQVKLRFTWNDSLSFLVKIMWSSTKIKTNLAFWRIYLLFSKLTVFSWKGAKLWFLKCQICLRILDRGRLSLVLFENADFGASRCALLRRYWRKPKGGVCSG